MIFCARATRGRGLPSLDARSGRSISPHPLKRERASLEGALISFDARSKGQPCQKREMQRQTMPVYLRNRFKQDERLH